MKVKVLKAGEPFVVEDTIVRNNTVLVQTIVLYKPEWELPNKELIKLIDAKLECAKDTILDAIDNKLKS